MTTDLRDALDRHVRDCGLRDVVDTLVAICFDTATDIEANGPSSDHEEADPDAWRAAAHELQACRDAVPV